MSKRRMVPVTIYLTQEQIETIREISKNTDVPQSALIRRGVDHAIAASDHKPRRCKK